MQAVGEDWTEEMEEAWKELWFDTCERLLNLTNDVRVYACMSAGEMESVLEKLVCWRRGHSRDGRMAQAEKHGFKVQAMWRSVQTKTTRANFGSALRKMLLSGTEWVQSLSSRPTVATEKGGEHGDHSMDGKRRARQRRRGGRK